MERYGQIRVGRRKYARGGYTDPSFPGFTPIICLTKSTAYGSLSPYVIKDEKGRIMENVWHNFPSEINLSKYKISICGDIKNLKGYILKNTPNKSCGGYIRSFLLHDDGKGKTYLRHRLVALVFLKKPKSKDFVDHINNNRTDNRVENLRWVTKKENNNNAKARRSGKSRSIIQMDLDGSYIKKWDRIVDAQNELNISKSQIILACKRKGICHGYKWKYAENIIQGEKWKLLEVRDNKIEVSDRGRIKLPSGKITYGYKAQTYLSVSIYGKGYRVHRLICMAFKPVSDQDILQVNHIDTNKHNNKLDNLEWCSAAENMKHEAKHRKNKEYRGGTRKILQLDRDDNIIAEYNSMAEANRITGISKGNICSVCRGNRPLAGNFKWKYVTNSKMLQTLK